MDKIFDIHDLLPAKISFFHLLLFVISLPFDRFYSEVILVSFAIHAIIHFNKSRLQGFPVKNVLLLQSIFFLTVVATVHTVNLSRAFPEWEQQLAILLFPVLFVIAPVDVVKYRRQLTMVFAVTCTLTIMYLEVEAVQVIRYYHLNYSALFSDAFINWNFSDPINIHPTYLSMYVALSIAAMVSIVVSTKSVVVKVVCALSIILLSVSLLQLGSRAVMLSFLLLVILAPFFLTVSRNKKMFLMASLVLSIMVLSVYKQEALHTRFISNMVDDVTKDERGKTKNEYRIVRWRAAIDLIKQSPIVGFGTGSEIPLLKKQYFERKLYNSFINQLNAHNQYLSLAIQAGCIGVLLFLFVLYKGFSIAVRRKDFEMFTFLILIAAVSCSENILDVNKGIFFYSFFFSLFLLTPLNPARISTIERQPNQQKKRFYNREMAELY